jgi:glucose-6-phosphate 1-dehydrogenase
VEENKRHLGMPFVLKAMKNLNRKLKEMDSLQEKHDNPDPSQYFEPSSEIKFFIKRKGNI